MPNSDVACAGIWFVVVGVAALLFAAFEDDSIAWRIAKAIGGFAAIGIGIAVIVA